MQLAQHGYRRVPDHVVEHRIEKSTPRSSHGRRPCWQNNTSFIFFSFKTPIITLYVIVQSKEKRNFARKKQYSNHVDRKLRLIITK